MAEVIQYLGFNIEIRRRSRKRNLAVSVYPTGEIRVSVNKSLAIVDIVNFLEANKDWLLRSVTDVATLRAKHPQKIFKTGEIYSYLGREYRLKIQVGPQPLLTFADHDILFTSAIAEQDWTSELRQKYFARFRQAFRKVAEKIMIQRLELYSYKMRLYPTGIQFRRQNSIWGSCSPENKISLNYKLIVAPIEVIDYVIIHELAHIQHKNHSVKFWKLVEEFTPHRHLSKCWLKEHQFTADFLSKKSELGF